MKKILSLALALVLCLGLAAPVMAAEPELPAEYLRFSVSTGGMLLDKIGEYPLNAPASGDGWSYDGNYTLTLKGLVNEKMFIDVLTNYNGKFNIVLADGTKSRIETLRIERIFQYYDTNMQKYVQEANGSDLTISGNGNLSILGPGSGVGIVCGCLTMNGGTLDISNGGGCDVRSLVMNNGTIQSTGRLSFKESSVNGADNWENPPTVFNGGTLILDFRKMAEALKESFFEDGYDALDPRYHSYYCPVAVGSNSRDKYDRVAQQWARLDGKFVGADGQPLTVRTNQIWSGPSTILYNSDGSVASYIKFTKQPTVPVGGFTDVLSSDYFAEAVRWAVDKKITTGTTETTFSPYQTCIRAQIITFLWRALGCPEPKNGGAFSDVSEGDYYYKSSLWAREKGLVSGNTFGWEEPCKRSDVVTYLWKLAGSPAASGSSFTDVPKGAPYAQAVAWAVKKGITNGTTETTFSPEDTCIRGQIVTFLYRDLVK